jgi:hypothetical protein
MKDCTFTIEVDGQRMTYDYDGIRAFLMDKGNLEAVAPKFAGVESKSQKKSKRPDELRRAQGAPSTSLTMDELYVIGIPELRSPLQDEVPTVSKYATGAEAREGLQVAARAYKDELDNLAKSMNTLRNELLTVRRKRTKQQEQQLEADFLALKQDYTKAKAKRRDSLLKLLAPGGLADITWRPMKVDETIIRTGVYTTVFDTDIEGDLPDDITKKIQVGFDYFRLIVGNHPDLKGGQIGMRYFEHQPDQRAFFMAGTTKQSYVELSGSDMKTWIIVHELGHWLESVSPVIHERVVQFLKRRAGTERPQKLSALTEQGFYKNDEYAVKDEFREPYVGKYYPQPAGKWTPRKLPKWEDVYASEVISMGLQYLYEDPVLFAKQDPDMFDFIFDVLRVSPSSTGQ